ncbi:glycosyltransferase family 4 protein [Chloroflexota bacterium]
MKVLFVLEYYPPHIGGVEVMFQNLCEGLAKRDHNITLVTSRLAGTETFEVINGVTIHRIKVPQRGTRYWFTLLSIPQVLRSARKADIVHTTTYNGAFPAWFASKLLRKSCTITVHEVLGSLWKESNGMGRFSAALHQLLERLIVSLRFDRYVGISKYTCSCLHSVGVRHDKLELIYNAIDYDVFNPAKADGDRIRKELGLVNDFIFMYYGRPGISKGIEYLVQSVPLIAHKIPNSKLILILAHEPANRYKSIRNLIDYMSIGDRIILLNPLPRAELLDYIAASDCVVVPSLSEGFGYTAAEACAMGKPVVASNAGSLPEVISGRSVLVEPRNPAAIAEGVETVFKGKVKSKKKRYFTSDQCIDKYLSIYQEMLSDK